MNLLQETITAIEQSGHGISDIRYIGSSDGEYRTDWETFQELADVEYDDGYGSPEVAPDLIFVFNDLKKMWRAEYDGSEWWEYDSPLDIKWSSPGKPITRLIGGLWRKLADLHDEETSKLYD